MRVRAPTEQLIERLVASAEPVRPLRRPLIRATLWLSLTAAIGALIVLLFAHLSVFEHRAHDPKLVFELCGTLMTGFAAVIASFYLSLPDRLPGWALLPIPPLVLWIASSGYSCYRHWITFGPDGWQLGDSAQCFRFILATSVPLGILLWLPLRRAHPMAPARVAVVGGLGVAALAAFLLQFFHPFDVTVMDLVAHLAAVAIVVAVASAFGRTAQTVG
jgi:hypothetical protein